MPTIRVHHPEKFKTILNVNTLPGVGDKLYGYLIKSLEVPSPPQLAGKYLPIDLEVFLSDRRH